MPTVADVPDGYGVLLLLAEDAPGLHRNLFHALWLSSAAMARLCLWITWVERSRCLAICRAVHPQGSFESWRTISLVGTGRGASSCVCILVTIV